MKNFASHLHKNLEHSANFRDISRKYEILKTAQIASGSYGTVHVASHKKMHSLHACKIIQKTLHIRTEDVTAEALNVYNEVENMRLVAGNPFIARFDDFFEDQDHYCIVQELITGGTLPALISTCPGLVDITIIRCLATDLLTAIAACAEKGVVHNDIKPQNVMLQRGLKREDYQFKLIDFGSSCIQGQRLHFVSPSYAAPEIYKSGGRATVTNDVWSAGALLLEASIGLWDPASKKAEIKSVATRDPELADLIAHLMNSDPTQRLTAAESLSHPFLKT